MSDPGTTYRTREEIQKMRSTQDCINGLGKYITEVRLASPSRSSVLLQPLDG